MEIAEERCPDPTADKGSPWVVVRVAPVRALAHPVTLAAIKADPKLADMDLIRQSRLSVGRVPRAEWKHILTKSEKPEGRILSLAAPFYLQILRDRDMTRVAGQCGRGHVSTQANHSHP